MKKEYELADIILRLEWLTTCSDSEMKDGDEARALVNQLLPSLKAMYIDQVKSNNILTFNKQVDWDRTDVYIVDKQYGPEPSLRKMLEYFYSQLEEETGEAQKVANQYIQKYQGGV